MAKIYTTRQGETVDIACLRHYGRTIGVTETVLSANQALASLGAILPLGTKIIMPTIEKETAATALVSLWD